MAEREVAEAMTDAVLPPATWVDEPAERPGQAAKRIPTGHDYDDPAYLQALRPLQDRQAAFVVLKGVEGLAESTPGDNDAARTDAVMSSMTAKMIRFLAAEIWNMTYAQGDPNDFFTSEGSGPSQNSGLSPNKNPRATKPA